MPSNRGLFWLKPPYESFHVIDLSNITLIEPGTIVVWFLSGECVPVQDIDWVLHRPRGVCLAIVLPPPNEIAQITPALHRIADAHPNAVLPAGGLASPSGIRRALAGLPRNLPRSITNYLTRNGIVTDVKARAEIFRIFELAPKTTTVNRLCRDLYLSRRTLGRHFESCGLPVPSHWLQFARLLNVVLRAQSERLAVFKIALSAGYPDGFTLSNQLKRMTGYRPSQIRQLVGFEWLVERWLDMERLRHEQRKNDDNSREPRNNDEKPI